MIELYINNIFIKRVTFTLVRLTKQQETTVRTTGFNKVLLLLKHPIEHTYIALQPKENINHWRNWHHLSIQTQHEDYYTESPSISSLGLKSNGRGLFDSYIPHKYNITNNDRGAYLMNFAIKYKQY